MGSGALLLGQKYRKCQAVCLSIKRLPCTHSPHRSTTTEKQKRSQESKSKNFLALWTATRSAQSMNTDKDKGDLSQEAEKEEQTAFSEKPWKEIFVSCIPIALVCLLVWLDESILATAIPKISDEFDSFDQIGWYGPSYLFGLCSSQLPLGKAYQEFPTRITYLIFLLVFEVASIVQAAAPSSPAFIIGRILAGIGGAGILTGSLTIFSATIPKAKIPYVMGSFSWVHSIGTIAGPLVGGAITSSSLTWRW